MTILANISSLENLLTNTDLTSTERHKADFLLSEIRSAVTQLEHQEFLHSSSASTPDVASVTSPRG